MVGRGKFARLAVLVDLNKSLLSCIRIDGSIQKLEYEYSRFVLIVEFMGTLRTIVDLRSIRLPHLITGRVLKLKQKNRLMRIYPNPVYLDLGWWWIIGVVGRGRLAILQKYLMIPVIVGLVSLSLRTMLIKTNLKKLNRSNVKHSAVQKDLPKKDQASNTTKGKAPDVVRNAAYMASNPERKNKSARPATQTTEAIPLIESQGQPWRDFFASYSSIVSNPDSSLIHEVAIEAMELNDSHVVDNDIGMEQEFGHPANDHPTFRRYLKMFVNEHKLNFVALFKTRVSGQIADKVISKAWISNQYINSMVHVKNGHSKFQLTTVYASDFNVILSVDERVDGSRLFADFIHNIGLSDLGFWGSPFTWSRSNLHQRVDQCIVNAKWNSTFMNSHVSHLDRLRSDHLLLLVSPDGDLVIGGIVRVVSLMLGNLIGGIVRFENNINQFQKNIENWNNETFGHIGSKKKRIRARLRGIERTLLIRHSESLLTLSVVLKTELENIMEHEESFWGYSIRNKSPKLSDSAKNGFLFPVINDEIRRALFDMGASKAPGVDGSNAWFYQANWNIIGDALCQSISGGFGFTEVDDLGKYLGVPLLHSRVDSSSYQYLVQMVQRKLSGWKASCLSLAGRITLVRAVLFVIPSYIMQTAVIPKHICLDFERLIRQFVWGNYNSKNGIPLVKWDDVRRSVPEGGLGFRKIAIQNEAFLMKLAFNLLTRKNDLWVKFIWAKYKCSDGVQTMLRSSNCSLLWKCDFGLLAHVVDTNYVAHLGNIPVAAMANSNGDWKWNTCFLKMCSCGLLPLRNNNRVVVIHCLRSKFAPICVIATMNEQPPEVNTALQEFVHPKTGVNLVVLLFSQLKQHSKERVFQSK
ncbi:hypothetical protein F3Y22_tig00111298pilonHSYRG00016 [Hibiscus syriacus]|uniref:Uncharacterized protein n=1 Tax=Hibiscus syriacus TaxID=106335 RepID=A0A6A2YRC1_HIBSY|nr:hypothetical protein F3Y22_tig00111298pilonHSYRG00016 [Hibiscus syriacus]